MSHTIGNFTVVAALKIQQKMGIVIQFQQQVRPALCHHGKLNVQRLFYKFATSQPLQQLWMIPLEQVFQDRIVAQPFAHGFHRMF